MTGDDWLHLEEEPRAHRRTRRVELSGPETRMFGKKPALIIATALALVASGCGGGIGGATDPAAFGPQICGQTSAEPAGYLDTIGRLPSGSARLSGAGSSFAAPVLSVWAQRYAQLFGTQVAYQPIGSGGGVAQVIAGTVDFGATDTPMTAAERAKAGGLILHIPVTLGAVVPAYRVAGLGSGIRFDGEALGAIFAGRVTRWNDAVLQALNPGRRLPDRPIVVVHRSDASGTTAVWTDFLTKTSPTWRAAFDAGRGAGKQIVWPVGLAGRGNDGVAGMLAQVEGAIGYLELAYVLSQELPYGQVRNRAGAFIQPCPATVRRATAGVDYPADLAVSLTDGPDPNAYPITGTTYLLVYADQPDRAAAAALVNFLAWVLTAGQDLTAALGYAPLGADLQRLAYTQLRAVTVDRAALVPAWRDYGRERAWHVT